MSRQLEPYQLIERSIQKKFHKVLWTPFITAIKQYELIAPGDRIAVCISGGKDSMLMAKLLQLLQRHSDVPFEVVDLVMDPGYNAVNRQKIESNAALLHIPVTIFETNIFDVTSGIEQSPCYLCARMRRGYLYSKARELGCNKIALGHHFSDVVETTVMGMFYGSQLQAMPPKLRSRNFPGMELIRPMYCIHEDDIIAWQRWSSSSAPAALPSARLRTATTAAAPSGRRSSCCCASCGARIPTLKRAFSTAFTPSALTPWSATNPAAWSTRLPTATASAVRWPRWKRRTRNDAHRAYAPGGF